MNLPFDPRAGERRVLDEGGGVRAMTYVMGIMLFLTVLAAALGLATLASRAALARQLAGQLTVQIVVADPVARERQAARALTVLRGSEGVAQASAVDRAELLHVLRPWLGADGTDPDLPIPAMIDVRLASGTDAAAIARRVAAVAPAARVDGRESWMSPVARFMTTLAWLAAALVLLMASATAAVVMLAARAGLESHRATIDVLHMLGSTDRQIARLFQRRVALDTAIGGAAGTLAAIVVVALVGAQIGMLGSQLLSGATLGAWGWVVLVLLPAGFVVLATLAARWAVIVALRGQL